MYYLLTHWSSDIISNLEPNFSKERAPMGEKHFLNITKQFFKTVRKKKSILEFCLEQSGYVLLWMDTVFISLFTLKSKLLKCHHMLQLDTKKRVNSFPEEIVSS